ncbi:hypothetical protein N1851_000202 [Merluccius polli]|uniref:CCHC-type domain-containing protein n=1 Tax=Merluccius polli TaxID=89951 RepID=A0AA47P9W3_MERPO|nr:hypothetical protein N1851_000202 [Merluccius polli]
MGDTFVHRILFRKLLMRASQTISFVQRLLSQACQTPSNYSLFTQSDEKLNFTKIKTKLRSYESTEKFATACSTDDSVMKVRRRENFNMKLTCYSCGQKGHKALECSKTSSGRRDQRQWCSFCKSSTHKDANCRRRQRDKVKQAVDEEDHTFAFMVEDAPVSGVKEKGLMVDSGVTKHIVTDIAKFKDFDTNFKPQSHILELADGVRTSSITIKKGTAKVCLRDTKGRIVDMMLMEVLYVPLFSQDIFSVKARQGKAALFI